MKKCIDICKNGTSYMVKKIINRNFIDVIDNSDPDEYALDNKNSIEQLYYELIAAITEDPMNCFNKKSQVLSIFLEAGIIDIQNFAAMIKSNIDNMKKTQKMVFGEYKSIMTKKLDFLHKWQKKHNIKLMSTIAADAEFAAIPEEERSHYYVVRSHYGEYPIQFYYIGENLKWSAELSQILRTKYFEDTNCDYFEGRPIMALNWYKLDEKHRMMTYDGE